MNIYFSGIGGVGIGPLAEIALDAGYSVVGSDPQESLITNELIKRGIEISKNQDGGFLKECNFNNKIDWFVYTSALPIDHPELIMAQSLGIKTAKRDEIIARIIDDKGLKLIAIAGTHGKTTTTGMMIWTMQQLGIPVSYSIGTTLSFGPSGKLDPNSEYFVYECDEFDRNFLSFNPFFSVITSIDYDHPDTYPSEDEYLNAFRQFALQSNKFISWNGQHEELFNDISKGVILKSSDIIDLPIVGRHNRRNATLIQKTLKMLGVEQSTDEILVKFPGVNRRFEKIAEGIYSDYGHHPVEIAATLQMAHEISNHVMLVYQPHQNIRQHEIKNKNQYTNQFELAEEIFWLPTYLSREDPNLKILKPTELIQNISNKDKINISDLDDNLWAAIQENRTKGMLILCMGAGNIDDWIRTKLTNGELSLVTDIANP